jgi:mannose-1-phosphate guanylyltransferase
MVPIGLKQRPILEYVIRLLKSHQISDVVFLVDYKAEQIRNYFGDGSSLEVKISYVQDSPDLKGTGGSFINAYKQGQIASEDIILVYYGDILTNMNLGELLNYHREKKAIATVALTENFTVRVGMAKLAMDGRIETFVEKPPLDKPVSIGILVFDGSVLELVSERIEKTPEFDLMGDLIPYLIELEKPTYGYVSDAFWYDVGSIEAYEKLDHKLVEELFSHISKR